MTESLYRNLKETFHDRLHDHDLHIENVPKMLYKYKLRMFISWQTQMALYKLMSVRINIYCTFWVGKLRFINTTIVSVITVFYLNLIIIKI